MINGKMPAMPLPLGTETAEGCQGLTKREIMAMHAMQGQLASLCTAEVVSWLTSAMDERGINHGYPEKLIAINAVNYADALLAELEKSQ